MNDTIFDHGPLGYKIENNLAISFSISNPIVSDSFQIQGNAFNKSIGILSETLHNPNLAHEDDKLIQESSKASYSNEYSSESNSRAPDITTSPLKMKNRRLVTENIEEEKKIDMSTERQEERNNLQDKVDFLSAIPEINMTVSEYPSIIADIEEDTKSKLLEKGKQNIETELYEVAQSKLSKAKELRPQSGEIRAYLGRAYQGRAHQNKDNLPRAISSYKTAIEFGFTGQDLIDVIKFSGTVKDNPLCLQIYIELAEFLHERENQDQATAMLREVEELINNGTDINEGQRKQFGCCLVKIDAIDKAIIEFAKIIELAPDEIDAYSELAKIYEDRGEYNKSCETLSAALETNPDGENQLRLYNRLFQVLELKGDYQEARKILLSIAEIDYLYEFEFCWISILAAEGDYSEAIAILKGSEVLDPTNDVVLFKFAYILTEKRDYDSALHKFEKIERPDYNVLVEKARTLMLKGEFDKAITACEDSIRMHPHHHPWEAYLYWGIVKSLKVNEKGQLVFNMTAEARDKVKEARKYYSKAPLYFYWGKALCQLGLVEEGMSRLEKALKVDPNFLKPIHFKTMYKAQK